MKYKSICPRFFKKTMHMGIIPSLCILSHACWKSPERAWKWQFNFTKCVSKCILLLKLYRLEIYFSFFSLIHWSIFKVQILGVYFKYTLKVYFQYIWSTYSTLVREKTIPASSKKIFLQGWDPYIFKTIAELLDWSN